MCLFDVRHERAQEKFHCNWILLSVPFASYVMMMSHVAESNGNGCHEAMDV